MEEEAAAEEEMTAEERAQEVVVDWRRMVLGAGRRVRRRRRWWAVGEFSRVKSLIFSPVRTSASTCIFSEKMHADADARAGEPASPRLDSLRSFRRGLGAGKGALISFVIRLLEARGRAA